MAIPLSREDQGVLFLSQTVLSLQASNASEKCLFRIHFLVQCSSKMTTSELLNQTHI